MQQEDFEGNFAAYYTSLAPLTNLLAASSLRANPCLHAEPQAEVPGRARGPGCGQEHPPCSFPHLLSFHARSSSHPCVWLDCQPTCREPRAGSRWSGSPRIQPVFLKGVSTGHLALGLWSHLVVSKLLSRWTGLRVTSQGMG